MGPWKFRPYWRKLCQYWLHVPPESWGCLSGRGRGWASPVMGFQCLCGWRWVAPLLVCWPNWGKQGSGNTVWCNCFFLQDSCLMEPARPYQAICHTPCCCSVREGIMIFIVDRHTKFSPRDQIYFIKSKPDMVKHNPRPSYWTNTRTVPRNFKLNSHPLSPIFPKLQPPQQLANQSDQKECLLCWAHPQCFFHTIDEIIKVLGKCQNTLPSG